MPKYAILTPPAQTTDVRFDMTYFTVHISSFSQNRLFFYYTLQGHSLLSQFKLSDEQLQNIRDRCLHDMIAGLKLNTSRQGIDMLPTFVCNTPDGSGT